MTTERTLSVTVVTPSGPVLLPKGKEEHFPLLRYSAKNVVLPIHDCAMGVESLHTPTIAKLGFGTLEIRTPKGDPFQLYIDGGVAQIKDNQVSVLASLAKTSFQIDPTELEKQLQQLGESKSLDIQRQKEKIKAQLAIQKHDPKIHQHAS